MNLDDIGVTHNEFDGDFEVSDSTWCYLTGLIVGAL